MTQTEITRYSDRVVKVAEIRVSTRYIHHCSSCGSFVAPELGAVCRVCGAVMGKFTHRSR